MCCERATDTSQTKSGLDYTVYMVIHMMTSYNNSFFVSEWKYYILRISSVCLWSTCIFTPCLKNLCNFFCQNFVKFPPILIIFGRKMAKRLRLCEVHLFPTSPNSRHHTTVLNADVPNCYTTLKVVICNKLSNDLINI